MKNQFYILFIALGLLVNVAMAQEKPTHNYIVITRNIEQLTPIIKTAAELTALHKGAMGTYEVVICGKAVTALTNAATMQPLVAMAAKNNVRLIACGLSLDKFTIPANQLVKGISIVPNGLLYNFTKQEEGYLSIEL